MRINGIEPILVKPPRMQLNLQDKIEFQRNLKKLRGRILKYASGIQSIWTTKSLKSIIADIEIEMFIETQQYWERNKYNLDKYMYMCVNWVCTKLKRKYGTPVLPMSQIQENIYNDIYEEE